MGHVELSRVGYLGRTMEHGEIAAPLTLAIMGHTFDQGSKRWDCDNGGQIVDTLTRMNPAKLAEGWTSEDVAALHNVWQRWHLNTMRAACAHQEVVYEDDHGQQRPSLDKTPPCPRTGYRYGHAWLTDPLPDEAAEQARRFADMLDGTDGLRQR